MKSKHKKAIMCLVDTTEAILNVFQKHKINPDKVAEHYEFKVLVHLLKTIRTCSKVDFRFPQT